MFVDYNKIAEGFSSSRKKMKWEEIDYFISSYLSDFENKNFLDIGCGSARLLEQFSNEFDIKKINYLGLDLSDEMLKYASSNFPDKEFLNLNMLDLDNISGKKFDYIFFIASFHHLDSFEKRQEVLRKTYKILKKDGFIFMTNWALNSELNYLKYKDSIIQDTTNEFGSLDYNIKIGEYDRYYHSFSLKELEKLFIENDFEIIENREFENKRNFISIIQKIRLE